MKKVVSYFSLTSMVTNNFCNQYCDEFKFKFETQEEKDKKEIFDKIYKHLLESKGISKFLDLDHYDGNDSFFVMITEDGIEFFDIFENVATRYRNLSQLENRFGIDYSSYVCNKYDYEKSKKYITKIKTKDIKYNKTNVDKYDLQDKLEQLKKKVFLGKDYGFYILKDGYSDFIKKEFPEFKIEYDGEFTISVNTEYCEHKKEYQNLYTFKVYVSKRKLKNDDYYLINDLTKDKIKKVEIKYNYYKLQSLDELEHFADVELNKELGLHHSRSIKLCNDKGKILKKTNELPKGTYYIKLDLFKSKSVKKFLEEEKVKFEEINKKLDEIVKNKTDYKNKIQRLYEEWEKYNSKFFNEHQNLDTLKEKDEDYSNLHSEILDFRDKIIGTFTILQFLDEINSDLEKIKINGELIDQNLFKYKDEINRINQIALLCKGNKLVYEITNINFKKDEIKEIKSVYKSYADDNELDRYCKVFVFNNVSRELYNDLDNKVAELSKKYKQYLESIKVKMEYELDTSEMKCDFDKGEYEKAFKDRCERIYNKIGKGENILDELNDLMNWVEVEGRGKRYFFKYFIDGEQIFDRDNERNIVKSPKKIKIVPTRSNYGYISIYNTLVDLQREKFKKETFEKINNAKSVDELKIAFPNLEHIIENKTFTEWTVRYEKFENSYSLKDIDYDLKSSKFKDLASAITKKFTDLKKANLSKEGQVALKLLEKAYQSVVDKYKGIIGSVNNIDELNKLNNKNVNNIALKQEVEKAIKDNDAKDKILVSDKELYDNTILKYVNNILKISEDKMNELKNVIANGIVDIYNLAVQEMKNNIKNSTDIDSLKKLGYEDKKVISTELIKKINSKDSNLENKKKKYAISININTYVDDIFNEYKKKESSLKSGHKNEDKKEDNKEERQGSVQSSGETTKEADKEKGNKSRCSNYKKKEQ